MVRYVSNLCLLALVVMALAACSSSKKEAEENPNVLPADYKSEILNAMLSALENPINVRDAYISEPVLRPAAKEQRYSVCVRANPRDLSNVYIGPKDYIAFFYGGHLNQVVEATKEQCGNAAYKPFPELEKLCQARKCV